MNKIVTSPFDYGALDTSIVEQLKKQTERIKARLRKHAADIIETGRDLLAVKGRLEHGLFQSWIHNEINISLRTAQAFMSVARMADNDSKSATVALLPPATAYRLAAKSTSTELRERILERVAAGDVPSDQEVADLIQADALNRAALKREVDRKKLSAGRRRRLEQRERERADREERLRQENVWTTAALLFESWNSYATKAGDRPGTKVQFSQALTERGFRALRKMSGRGFCGIRLSPDAARRVATEL